MHFEFIDPSGKQLPISEVTFWYEKIWVFTIEGKRIKYYQHLN